MINPISKKRPVYWFLEAVRIPIIGQQMRLLLSDGSKETNYLKSIVFAFPSLRFCLRNRGVDSPITKKSGGSRPPFDIPLIIIIL